MGAVFMIAASIISAALIVYCDFEPTMFYNVVGIAGILIGLFGYCIDNAEE